MQTLFNQKSESMKAFTTAIRTVVCHQVHLGKPLQPKGRIGWSPNPRIGGGEAISCWREGKVRGECGYSRRIPPSEPFV